MAQQVSESGGITLARAVGIDRLSQVLELSRSILMPSGVLAEQRQSFGLIGAAPVPVQPCPLLEQPERQFRCPLPHGTLQPALDEVEGLLLIAALGGYPRAGRNSGLPSSLRAPIPNGRFPPRKSGCADAKIACA